MKSVKKHIILVFLTLVVSFAYAQKGAIKDEDDLIKRADQLFEKEDYVAAFSLYQTLLSNHEDNPEYNFRYAVCLMYADRSDKTKPIFYMEKVLKNPDVDKRLFYFLGTAYQMNYQFTDAIESFERFRIEAKSSWTEKYNINRRIEECKNGLYLLAEVRGIYVINKVEVKEQSFHRSYETSKSGGKIIVLPDELRTKLDKKSDAPTVAFFSNSGQIYFASYGEKNITGLDIYSTFQNPDGSWAKPVALSNVVNTAYDDAYPYISMDGKILYFSSKGHNSMGGFDVFRTTYDLSISNWTAPLNMSFPLNTPFDEIMFLPDSNSIYAYFSSNRNTSIGLIDVFRIGLNKRPSQTIDMASGYKSGQVETTIAKVKEMANLQTNIQWENYEKTMAATGDFLGEKGQQQVNQVSVNQKLNITEEKKPLNLSPAELVDSVFGVYKVLKVKGEELSQKKKVIQKINAENQKELAELSKKPDSINSLLYRQIGTNINLGKKLEAQLEDQIKEVKSIDNQVVFIAGQMQQAAMSKENEDSLNPMFEKVISLYTSIDTTRDVSSQILAVEQQKVKELRKIAADYLAKSQEAEKEVVSLKQEQKEYAEAAMNPNETEESRQEYSELAESMKSKIDEKENEKDVNKNQWKSYNSFADSIGDNLAEANSMMNNYIAQVEGIDYKSGKGIDETAQTQIQEEIKEIRKELNNKYGELTYPESVIAQQSYNQKDTAATIAQAGQETEPNPISSSESTSNGEQTTNIQGTQSGIGTNIGQTPENGKDTTATIAQAGQGTQRNQTGNGVEVGQAPENKKDTAATIAQAGQGTQRNQTGNGVEVGQTPENGKDTAAIIAQAGQGTQRNQTGIGTNIGQTPENGKDTAAIIAQAGQGTQRNQTGNGVEVGQTPENGKDTAAIIAQAGQGTQRNQTGNGVEVGQTPENGKDTAASIAQAGQGTQRNQTGNGVEVGQTPENGKDTAATIAQAGQGTKRNQTSDGTEIGQTPENGKDTAASIAQAGQETQRNQTGNGVEVGQTPENGKDTAATIAQAGQGTEANPISSSESTSNGEQTTNNKQQTTNIQGNQTSEGTNIGQTPENGKDTVATIAQAGQGTQRNQTGNGVEVGQTPENGKDTAATIAQAGQGTEENPISSSESTSNGEQTTNNKQQTTNIQGIKTSDGTEIGQTPENGKDTAATIAQAGQGTQRNQTGNGLEVGQTPENGKDTAATIAQAGQGTQRNQTGNGVEVGQTPENGKDTAASIAQAGQSQNTDSQSVNKVITEITAKEETIKGIIVNNQIKTNTLAKIINEERKIGYDLTTQIAELNQDFQSTSDVENRSQIQSEIALKSKTLFESQQKLLSAIEIYENYNEKEENAFEHLTEIDNAIESFRSESNQEDSQLNMDKAVRLNQGLEQIEKDLTESLRIENQIVNSSIDDVYRLESDNTINNLELNRIEKEIELSAGERQLALIAKKDSLLEIIEYNSSKITKINNSNSQANALNYIASRLDDSDNGNLQNVEKAELASLETIKNEIKLQSEQVNRVLDAVNESEQTVASSTKNSNQQLKIKDYGSEEQNQVAQKQLQPLVQTAERNQIIHKELLSKTSITTKLLNNEIQNLTELKEEIAQLDSEIKTNTSDSKVTELNDKKTELVEQYNESLAKANAIMLLNQNLIQSDKIILSDIEEINNVFEQVDEAISASDYKSAKALSSNLKLNYSDTSANIENQIRSLTSQINQEITILKTDNKKRISTITKAEEKIESLENQRRNLEAEAYLTESDSKKAKNLSKANELEEELKIEKQSFNQLKIEAQPIENQIVQKELIVKSLSEIQSIINNLPAIAQAENQETVISAESESLSQKVAEISKPTVSQPESSLEEKESSEIKYFNELDQIVIKKFYLENELSLLNSHVNSLRIRRSRVNDISLKGQISDDIEDAEAEVEDIEEEIAQLTEREEYLRTLGYTLVYGNYASSDTSVVSAMLEQSQIMRATADSLELQSSLQKGKLKKSLKLQSKALNQNAMQLLLTSTDIRASQNKTKYLANLVEANSKLNQIENDVMQNQGLVLLESGIDNFELAAENREALKNPKLTEEERSQIRKEAENLEQLALNQQSQAINLINSTLANSGRGAEEIPTDSPIIANTNSETTENEQVAENPNTSQNNISNNTQQTQVQEATPDIEQTGVERPSNLSIETINKMSRKELLTLDESLLSPEVQREVQIKKSESIGVYIAQNQESINESFYNESKPIVIQQDLPEGLIYKIQIAAFRNTVNPNLIVGITPISIEQRPNSAWYRYMAGVFTAYDDAVGARNQIRQMGYTDAFIVPYFNGQRITVAQARQLIQSGQAFTDKKIAEVAIAANKTTYTAAAPSQPTVAGTTPATTSVSPDAIPEGDFSTPELFYSVQIGVFGGSRTKDRLLNLNDLMYDRMPNGYYRYFNGKYTDVNSALTMQREIRNRGIRDAFIVAFYNGQKISVNRAREISPTNTQPQPETNQVNQPTEPVTNQVNQPTEPVQAPINQAEDVNENIDNQVPQQDTTTYIIVYKVQIGAFRNNIPVSTVNSMIQLPFDIEKQTREDGLNIYLIGSFDNYEAAVNMRSQVANLGIPEAFVVVYVNGIQRSIEDAKELQRR